MTEKIQWNYYICWQEEIDEIINNDKSEFFEVINDTTKIMWYKIDWVMYITDMIQL